MRSQSAHRPGKEPKRADPAGLRDRLLAAVGRVSTRWPAAVIALFAVLTAVAYLYIRDFPIRTAYLDLLPRDDPLVKKFQAVEQDMASTDVIAVVFTLRSPPADGAERERILVAAAERVIAELPLDGSSDLVSASYRAGAGIAVPPAMTIFRTLSAEELDRMRQIGREVQAEFTTAPIVRPPGDMLITVGALPTADAPTIRSTLTALTTTAREARGLLERILAQQDLLAEAAAMARKVIASEASLATGELILSRDRTRLVLQIWPTRRPFESLPYNQAVTRTVREAVSRVDLNELGVTAGITGTYVTTVEADEMIRRDMGLVTIVSSIAVFVLVLGAFASPLLCLAAVLPVLVSALFTMAWAKLAVGGFNLLTVFLPALILGLGIDYSVHILSRYVEERAKGLKAKPALITAVRTKGGACLTAAATTAVVFTCLLLSHSSALREMGAITGVGILMSLATTFFLTPALVAVTARNGGRLRQRPIASTTALQPVFRRFLRLRPGVVAVALILTAAIVTQASRVQFRFVSDQLAPVTPSQVAFQTVAREFAGDVWLGDTFRFFVESADEIAAVEKALASHPLVHSVSSVRRLLPTELLGGEVSILNLPAAEVLEGVTELQRWLDQWNTTLAALNNLIVDAAQLELSALLQGQFERAAALSQGIDDLVRLLLELETMDAADDRVRLAAMVVDLEALKELVEEVARLPSERELIAEILDLLPAEMRAQFITRTGNFVIEGRVLKSIYQGHNLRTFLDWLDDTVKVDRFGLPEVTAQLESYMRRDFLLSTALAVVFIFLLVWRDFPRPVEAALALAPLGMGYVWMLAGMTLLEIPFNFTNIVISPLLIGIGVDSAVHLLHRVKEERAAGGDAAVRGAAASTVPIAVSSLTTMASFGALLAAHTPGLRLLGTSALLGLGFTLLWSVTFLPAALALLVEKRRRRE